VNAGIAGAVTAVPHDTFIGGRPIRGPERLSSGRFTVGAVSATAPAIAPIRQSVLGNGRPAFHPASAVLSRPVVARMTPPAPAASFERQRAAVVANGNRPLEPAQLQQLSASGRAAAERPLPPQAGAGPFSPRPEPRPQIPPAAPMSGQRPLPLPAAPRSNIEPRPFTPPAPPVQMSPRMAPVPQMPHPAPPPPPAAAPRPSAPPAAPHASQAPAPHADNGHK